MLISELSYLEDMVETSPIVGGTYSSLTVISKDGEIWAWSKGSPLKKKVIKHKGYTTTIFKAGSATAEITTGKSSGKSWLNSFTKIFSDW